MLILISVSAGRLIGGGEDRLVGKDQSCLDASKPIMLSESMRSVASEQSDGGKNDLHWYRDGPLKCRAQLITLARKNVQVPPMRAQTSVNEFAFDNVDRTSYSPVGEHTLKFYNVTNRNDCICAVESQTRSFVFSASFRHAGSCSSVT